VVFVLALVLRLLFWQATADAAWPYSLWLKGDAIVWLEYARALAQGRPFEQGLPLRPPGMGYLVWGLWDGSVPGVARLKLIWAVLGAASVAAFALAARRCFGPRVASVVALWCATSTGLLVLGSSLDVETPYLLVVAGALLLTQALDERPRPGLAVLWGAAQALGCLLRVEHLLFVVLVCLWLAWRGRGRALVFAAAPFLLVLVPWHVHAWNAVARLNGPGTGMPAFAREAASMFVTATARHRGGAADLHVLDEAFGYEPRPLAAHPFVALYGPLNFALANNDSASGGFSTALLEAPPPLAGGAERFPPELVHDLPPPQLALAYPPHLRLVNDGYAVGWAWIRAHPGGFVGLAWKKLRIFWSGAALGLTGYGVPAGLSGLRRAVDLVTPEPGPVVIAWQLALAAVCLWGATIAIHREAAAPWLLFLLSKLVVTIAFFGYARLGATCIPVVAALVGLALERYARPRVLVAIAVALVATEAARFGSRPAVWIDGRRVVRGDPFPVGLHRDQTVEVHSP
jgi:hypothetical protein